MKPERWQRIEQLFHAALEREAGERVAFLADACAGDESIRREVESLLASHERGGRSLDAADLAADLLDEDLVRNAVGRSIGPYKILEPLGAGGMGAVFLAQDTKLARRVALKLLPREFTRERDRLRRFEQEARAASALNHPNIVTVYDSGDFGDVHFIAMEFVDGVTLRERLARGRLKLGEALDAATQIAGALAAAHAAGIVHRDVKPENILLRRDGYVKVVDFGLAKLTVPPAAMSDARPTQSTFRTASGVVVGTPHYMSPEQVRGEAPDHRSDIFGFGAVLYEMLSGRRAFQRATGVEAMNAILNDEPPDMPAEIPPPLQRIVRRCLEKQPERRFQSADDLAFTLRALAAGSEPGIALAPSAAPAARRRVWTFGLAAAALLLLAAAAALFVQRTELFWRNPLEGAHFSRLTDFDGSESNAALSADGKFVVFFSDRDGPFDAWVTQVGSGHFTNLTRGRLSELANEIVRNIGFSADASNVWMGIHDGKGSMDLWSMPTMGGASRLAIPHGVQAEWSRDGRKILYHEAIAGDPIFIADSDGSNPKQIFVDKYGYHCHYPTWSPDGRYVYFVRGIMRDMDVWRIPSVGGAAERITSHRSWVVAPTLLDDRTLLYSSPAEDGSGPWLYAIDVERRVPRRVSLGVEQYTSISAAADGHRLVAAVANPTGHLWKLPIRDHPAQEVEAARVDGIPNVRAVGPRYGPNYLLYLSSGALWKLRNGSAFELWRGSQGGEISPPAISSTGDRVALVMRKQGRGILYAMSGDGTGVRTLAESLDASGIPSWSPDGRWLVVTVNTEAGPRLFKIPVDGGAGAQLVDEMGSDPVWSPDGARIVYSGPQIGIRMPVKAVSPDGKPQTIPDVWVPTAVEGYRFLPDGKGLVFVQGGWKSRQFHLLNLETGEKRALSGLKQGFSMRNFDVSPDGKQIVFDRIRDNSDLVLIDLKR